MASLPKVKIRNTHSDQTPSHEKNTDLDSDDMEGKRKEILVKQDFFQIKIFPRPVSFTLNKKI